MSLYCDRTFVMMSIKASNQPDGSPCKSQGKARRERQVGQSSVDNGAVPRERERERERELLSQCKGREKRDMGSIGGPEGTTAAEGTNCDGEGGEEEQVRTGWGWWSRTWVGLTLI